MNSLRSAMQLQSRSIPRATGPSRQQLLQPHVLNRLVVRFKPNDDAKGVVEKVQDKASDVKDQVADAKNDTINKIPEEVKQPLTNPMGSGTVRPEDWLSDNNFKVSPWTPAFTRRRELFVGRLAMLGIFAAGFWELFPGHPNITQQVVALGIPATTAQAAAVILAIIGYNTYAALGPNSPTWSKENQKDLESRPRYFDVVKFGFTKVNELFHGRVAMLAFLGFFLQQLRLGGLEGPGPLAQIAYVFRTPADDAFYSAVPTVFLGWAALATVLAYMNGKPGNLEEHGVP